MLPCYYSDKTQNKHQQPAAGRWKRYQQQGGTAAVGSAQPLGATRASRSTPVPQIWRHHGDAAPPTKGAVPCALGIRLSARWRHRRWEGSSFVRSTGAHTPPGGSGDGGEAMAIRRRRRPRPEASSGQPAQDGLRAGWFGRSNSSLPPTPLVIQKRIAFQEAGGRRQGRQLRPQSR